MPTRELRANLAPLLRLSIGLVIVTTTLVAIVANAALPGLGWGAAFALGAIVAPTNALAATTVFRRFGAPRTPSTFLEGEPLLNDATALILYRVAVVAAVSGTFVFSTVLAELLGASVGGVALGLGVGLASSAILRRLDDPPVEVVISLIVPYAAYLAADELGLSGVLAVVTAGLVIGSRLGTILTPGSRTLWLTGWRLVDFILNGFVFVLIGLELPAVLEGLQGRLMADILILPLVISALVIATRFAWVLATSLLPGSPRQMLARSNPALATRLTVVVGGRACAGTSRSRPHWPCRTGFRSATSSCWSRSS